MKPGLFILLFLSVSGISFAQDSTWSLAYKVKSTDLLIGISWQGNTTTNKTYRYYEVGIGRGSYTYDMEGGGDLLFIYRKKYMLAIKL